MSVYHRNSSGLTFSAKAEPNPETLCWFKRGDNHLQVYRAQSLLNRYIGGHFGPPWLQSNGLRWPFLLENGMLNLDTELALKHFQDDWSLPVSGCLCPRTRALLPPVLRFRGSLLRKRLKFPRYCPPNNPRTYGATPGPAGSSSSSKKTTTADPPKPAGTGTPATTNNDDDDDKPWSLTISPTWGYGASGPLWTSKSISGSSVQPDKLEVDQKTEVDFVMPTSWALGMGKLKLSIGGEVDTPVDKAHQGKTTLAANFQLQADDLVKNDYVSLSPFLKYSPQWQKDGDKWNQSNVLKGGLEVDLDLQKLLGLDKGYKGLKLEGDVSSGVQLPGGGNDPATTPKAMVPLEGNINLVWDLPTGLF